jgi:glutathione S-transferase
LYNDREFTMQLVLHVDGFFTSQWDASVLVALEEKRLEYTVSRALLRDGGGVPAGIGSRTGLQQVPTLAHGDSWICESLAIVEYLEEVFAPPRYPALLPSSPRPRARARQLMAYVRSAMCALRGERSFWMCVYPASPPPLSRAAEREAGDLCALAQHVVEAGELAAWTMGLGDLALTLLRLDRTGYVLPPPAAQVLDFSLQRGSFRGYLQRSRPPNPPPQSYAGG